MSIKKIKNLLCPPNNFVFFAEEQYEQPNLSGVNRPKQLTTHKTDWIAKEPGTRFGAAAFAAKMAPEFSIPSMGCGGQLAPNN